MERQKVLVTGAQGFVGRRLCHALVDRGYAVRATIRSQRTLHQSSSLELVETGDLGFFVDWSTLLKDVNAVVHLIARTHMTDEFGQSALGEYRRTNVDLTRRLAKAAVRAGVDRFIYMSSIKAVGNGASHDYCETTSCKPEDSYGISKWEAELELEATLRRSDCNFTILRPPLVYGPGVRGNFLRLLKMVQRGIPLPSISNARSLVHVENLVDATIHCLQKDAANNELFHVADALPISTADLIRNMGIGLERTPLLVPLPQIFLAQLGNALGKGAEIQRLVGSLTMSTVKIRQKLDWRSKLTTTDGVVRTSRAFAEQPWSAEPSRGRESTEVARAA